MLLVGLRSPGSQHLPHQHALGTSFNQVNVLHLHGGGSILKLTGGIERCGEHMLAKKSSGHIDRALVLVDQTWAFIDRFLTVLDGPLATSRGKRLLALLGYFFAALTGTFLVSSWQVSGALSEMHLPGKLGTNALSFPITAGPGYLQKIRSSWDDYLNTVALAHGDVTRKVAPPQSLVIRLFWLNFSFIVCYLVVLSLLLAMAHWVLRKARAVDHALVDACLGLVRCTFMLVTALAIVDFFEKVTLWGAYTNNWEWVLMQPFPIGPALSATKILLTVLVLLGLVIVTGGMLRLAVFRPLLQALVAARGVVLVVVLCWVLLSVRIGADQVDDVIRAWDWSRGMLTVLAAVLAVLVIAGSIARLTDQSVDRPDPRRGDSPLPLLGTIGILLVTSGTVIWWIGWGWGLIVPGAMVLILLLASLPFERLMQVTGSQDNGSALARDPSTDRNLAAIRRHGRLLARLVPAGLTLVLIWVVGRASAFDLFVREGQASKLVLVQAVVIGSLFAIGVLILMFPRRSIQALWVWLMATGVAFGLLLATCVWPVRWPEWLGSVAVLLLSVAVISGLLGLVVVIARRLAQRQRRLVPVFWVLGLKRFPAVAFVVVWVILIQILPAGGFHEIEVSGSTQSAGVSSPTLEQAYASWFAASAKRGSVRPMVLVGAQGGGIRAAVWTALVMECVFGPSPIPDTGEVCAGGSGAANPMAAREIVNNTVLPVFLASGASGGSVGLAAWTAYRVDVAAGHAPRTTIDGSLAADFVAPDLARLLTGDLAHMFLADNLADRARVFEHALAGDSASGPTWLSRGLRATWQQANGSGKWQIPVLALNGFQVENGCRFVVSPVHFDIFLTGYGLKPEAAKEQKDLLDNPTDTGCAASQAVPNFPSPPLRSALPRTTELIDYLCPGQDISLATAGHLSARFPYVSPYARVSRQNCLHDDGLLPPGSVTYVLDGGIYDNSGALTAQEAWRELRATAAAQEKPNSCVVPLFLQIDNSVDDVSPGARRPPDLLAPLQALLEEVNSRETVSRASAALELGPARSPAGHEVKDHQTAIDSLWFRIALTGQPGPQPPLGWTLAESTIKDMRAQLGASENKKQIAKLRQLLTSTTLTCG